LIDEEKRMATNDEEGEEHSTPAQLGVKRLELAIGMILNVMMVTIWVQTVLRC
jgi:hypothetical protein